MTTDSNTSIDDAKLSARVRELLAHDEVPREPPTNIWGGTGVGEICSLCAEPITPSELEFELVFASRQTLRLHRICHAVWEQERRRLRQ